jgi:hypothetical protein
MTNDLHIAWHLHFIALYRVQGRTTRQMKTLLFIAYIIAIIVFVTNLYGEDIEEEY